MGLHRYSVKCADMGRRRFGKRGHCSYRSTAQACYWTACISRARSPIRFAGQRGRFPAIIRCNPGNEGQARAESFTFYANLPAHLFARFASSSFIAARSILDWQYRGIGGSCGEDGAGRG